MATTRKTKTTATGKKRTTTTATTKNKKSTSNTKKVAKTEVETTEAAVNSQSTTSTTATPVEAYGYPVIEFKKIPHTAIDRGYNVRSEANVNKVDDILPSIRTIGVKDPIHILPNGLALDGYRRLNCCDIVAKDSDKEFVEVPVLVVNVPEAEIPFYQVLCSQRKGLVKQELHNAIVMYCLKNPEENVRDTAQKFNVSHTTVHKLKRITFSPRLGELYVNREINQQAAMRILEAAKQSGTEKEEKEFVNDVVDTAKEYQLHDQQEGKKADKLAARHINKAIKSISPTIDITNLKTEEEGEETQKREKRLNLKTLWKKVLSSGKIEKINNGRDDLINIKFNLSIAEYKALEKIVLEDSTKPRDDLEVVIVKVPSNYNRYDVWFNETIGNDAYVFLKDGTSYITFDDCAEHVATKLKMNSFALDGVPALRCGLDKINTLKGFKIKIVDLEQPTGKDIAKTTNGKVPEEIAEVIVEAVEETPVVNKEPITEEETTSEEKEVTLSSLFSDMPEIIDVTTEEYFDSDINESIFEG